MAERKEERRILRDLIKANIGLSKDRANALKKIFENPSPNITDEELQQNNRQRLEGMAEMAMVRLKHAQSTSSTSNLGGQALALEPSSPTRSVGQTTSPSASEEEDVIFHDATDTIPEIRIVPPEEEDEL
ncbi:hypothetical protein MMC07_001789 [Pseudocyphellaria aurata]|nr:hypothetical protein [Pseudocyphellaria aurata]